MGTHPIFESDFDCLTELKMGLAPATVVKTLTSRLFSVFTNILRRQLVEADSVVNRQLVDFRGRVLASHKSWTKKRINIKLYWIKKLELKMAFPQSELLDPKTEKEIIEMAADLVVNTVNLALTIVTLFIIYANYEAEKHEKEELEKLASRATISTLNANLATFNERSNRLELDNVEIERLMRQCERDNCALHTKLEQIKMLRKVK